MRSLPSPVLSVRTLSILRRGCCQQLKNLSFRPGSGTWTMFLLFGYKSAHQVIDLYTTELSNNME